MFRFTDVKPHVSAVFAGSNKHEEEKGTSPTWDQTDSNTVMTGGVNPQQESAQKNPQLFDVIDEDADDTISNFAKETNGFETPHKENTSPFDKSAFNKNMNIQGGA